MLIYQEIASAVEAIRNCQKSGNVEWEQRHAEKIESLIKDYFPSGSGFNAGTQFDIAEHVDGASDRLVFTTAFHHMNDAGYYDGWTEHKVILRPTFLGFDMKITGRNRNGIKDHIGDAFHSILTDSRERLEAALRGHMTADSPLDGTAAKLARHLERNGR